MDASGRGRAAVTATAAVVPVVVPTVVPVVPTGFADAMARSTVGAG